MNDKPIETDPRKVRSRKRLLDAATSLLSSGGVEAVTVDAVTKASRVARTTLYRHFNSSTELVAAALERMLPDMTFPEVTGDVSADLVAALEWVAQQIEDAPIRLGTIGWMAMSIDERDPEGASAIVDLRDRIMAQYRIPFDAVFGSEAGRRELGEVDRDIAFAQLAGPVLLARLTGRDAPTIDAAGRRRIVDDFRAAHRPARSSSKPA
ncbi:TetR/AcrR family transcriptional regulator [Gordonia sp. (in: high G+C Gram-positive bacteria)]|uniref:TetR/AcrR family transcriptional regulator n=1 Tax=Gordonia sp. (in: high G+C Gram-positive bacteria) TaxID=84139 RepID=UPI0039E4B55B